MSGHEKMSTSSNSSTCEKAEWLKKQSEITACQLTQLGTNKDSQTCHYQAYYQTNYPTATTQCESEEVEAEKYEKWMSCMWSSASKLYSVTDMDNAENVCNQTGSAPRGKS